MMEKLKNEEMDWFDKKSILVIHKGIAQRKLKKNEKLFTYGQLHGLKQVIGEELI